MEKIDYKRKLEDSCMRDADGDYGFTVHVKKAYEICLELELYYLKKLKEVELSSIKVAGETPKINLAELEKKIDEVLANESPEKFQKWLDDYRKKHPDHFNPPTLQGDNPKR